MRPMIVSTILKGIGIALIFIAWLATDDVQTKFYIVAGAYVFTSMAWYIAAQVAKQRLSVLKQLSAAVSRNRMFVPPPDLQEKLQ